MYKHINGERDRLKRTERQTKSLTAIVTHPNFSTSLCFLSCCLPNDVRTEERLSAMQGKHGRVQLSAHTVVCSPLVCIVSTRPTSLCKPTTRRLLCPNPPPAPTLLYHVVTSTDKKACGGTVEAALSAWVDKGEGESLGQRRQFGNWTSN